ncbi:MAG: hypothetical protein MRJ96_09085 [Nitrospirales bacterium]|nr:hypothetical protein [Nitrospira sp.]MDR4501587.1 hypothetical protein [Nitrospirales bacterium]
MKTIIVQGDGLSTVALPEFEGRTLLQIARTPNLDQMATQGELGYLTLPSEAYSLSSQVTHLALLGYDPSRYYSGLGPFEAASLEVVLEKQDIAFLCHFVTIGSLNGREETKKLGSSLTLTDCTAGGIETEDARELIAEINEQLGSETIQFYTGECHRHLMVWIGSTIRCRCHHPRTAQGHHLGPYLPTGMGADVMKELMEASRVLLRHHPINQEREAAQRPPANCLWLWGPGKAIELPQWKDRWAIPSMTISPSSIHRGIAIRAGMDVVSPVLEGESTALDDFRVYVQRCLDELESRDLVYVHVPIPYMDRSTDAQASIDAVEQFDELVVGPLMKSLTETRDSRLLVVANRADEDEFDSPRSPTPYAMVTNAEAGSSVSQSMFDEIHALTGVPRDATKIASRVLALGVS